MNSDASADWASAILGLHQLLCDHLQKSQPGALPVRLPDPADWLQAMARTIPLSPAPDLTFPLGLEGLSDQLKRDALCQSAAQRYGSAVSALHAAWLEIGFDAFRTLRHALDSESATRNLRGTYDLWISCGEKAFARQGASEHYAGLVSELINAKVSLLLACGSSSATSSQDSTALKGELAASRAREAKLRAELDALHQAGAGHTARRKKRTAKKKAQSAPIGKKKRSVKETGTTSASGQPGKTARKKAASIHRQRRSKP